MYGNTEGQTGCCWHSILMLWEGDRRFEIISCKRPQGEHDWPGYHSRLMWYSSRWELQAHSLKFPVPGGRWGCKGLSRQPCELGRGLPQWVWMQSCPNTARAVQGERIGDALPSLGESKNIPKLRSTGPTRAMLSPQASWVGHVTDSEHSFMRGWK